jgi:hypothetical protein
MRSENSGWGAPKIHGELLKLGFQISERTVGRYCFLVIEHGRRKVLHYNVTLIPRRMGGSATAGNIPRSGPIPICPL